MAREWFGKWLVRDEFANMAAEDIKRIRTLMKSRASSMPKHRVEISTPSGLSPYCLMVRQNFDAMPLKRVFFRGLGEQQSPNCQSGLDTELDCWVHDTEMEEYDA